MAKKDIESIIKDIESLTVLELNELVKALEEKFGVSAAMVAPTAVGAGAAGGEKEAAAEEKSEYTIELTEAGEQKIKVIKAVREINQSLGLKDAKELVEAAPKVVAENIKKEEAEAAKKKLTAVGAKVTLK